jgi:hypothetical protein
MFERMTSRVQLLAERRARARIAGLAARIRDEVPKDVEVEETKEGVRLKGRNLRRRFALEPALRWLTERVR